MIINSARPRLRYARSGDVHVAYLTLPGTGPPLVFVPGLVSHLDLLWEEPAIAWFMRRLGALSRLIVFDKRGTGLSDPVMELPSTATRMDDIRAVMDDAGMDKAILLGASEGGALCTLFAALHPERTLGLALFGAFARLRWAPDYPFGWDDARAEHFTTDDCFAEVNPSVADDDHALNWAKRFRRCAASPKMFADLMRMNLELDIRETLSAIRVPTLVLHRGEDALVDIAHGRFLAHHILGATLEELPGADHAVWYGDSEVVLSAIERFVLAVRPVHPSNDVVALTARERDVMHHLYTDCSAVEISRRLRISSRTVESHIGSIYNKMGVNSRAGLRNINVLSE